MPISRERVLWRDALRVRIARVVDVKLGGQWNQVDEEGDLPRGVVGIRGVLLGIIVFGMSFSSSTARADSIFLEPNGTLNGTTIDSTNYEISVLQGEAITGSVKLKVFNSHHSGAVVPVGATVTWGNRESALWQVRNHVGTGTTRFSTPVNVIAPSTPGRYFLVFANQGECRFYQVMSATNWGLPHSGSSCGGAQSPAVWHDGNDLGWDWTSENFQQARDSGQVTQQILLPRTGSYSEATYGATWVAINVAATDDYAAWRDLHFGDDYPDPGKELLVWGDDADPEHDGLTNLLEFAMGLDPSISDNHFGPRVRVEDGEVIFTYPQTTATDHDVIAYVSWSGDLEHWTSGGLVYSLAEDLGDTMMIEAKLVVPREDRVFMRLEALRVGDGP